MKRNLVPATTLQVLAVATLLSILSALSACTVRTPTTETPVPNDRGVEKTFFRDLVQEVSASGETTTKTKSKTFLCAWASIAETTGAIATQSIWHAVSMTRHCNIEFEITDDALIGRMVNPSFPNDRARWKNAIVIPINKHYYYERAKDSMGRETNEYIENTSRSLPSARPMVSLNFDGISIEDSDLSILPGARSGKITNVTDIEWDKANGFFAFTASMNDYVDGAEVGVRVRFNFKSFEHNPGFKQTPYHPLNSQHFNAVHVVGSRTETLSQTYSAAKWDLNKTHEFYLYGMPEEYVPLAQITVDSWNDTLASMGKPRAFKLNTTKKMKYPFDLRYPMMVWIDDREIAESPLVGHGAAQADVRNGEILWGQVTLYGGSLEDHVKSIMNPGGPATAKSAKMAGSLGYGQGASNSFFFSDHYFNPRPLTLPFSIQSGRAGNGAAIEAVQRGFSSRLLNQLVRAKYGIKAGAQLSEQDQQAVERDVRQMSATVASSLSNVLNDIQRRANQTDIQNNPVTLYRFPQSPVSTAEKRRALADQIVSKIKDSSSSSLHCTDLRMEEFGSAVAYALSSGEITYEEGMRKVIRYLMMHELGHVLGLGHQFKENILPAEGSVPAKYMNPLKAAHKKNLTNTTSVMGYAHPMTEVLIDEEKILPGPHDQLVLRYLYNQEFATYKKGDSDFKFNTVPKSGLIPAYGDNPDYVTTYFPQCNDFDASFSKNPYCNRFDRGSSASEIVKNYFNDLNADNPARVYSIADVRGTNPGYYEYRMQMRALSILGRVRLFYDYMRQEYAKQLRPIMSKEANLYNFSKACMGEIEGGTELRALFNENPELTELCQTNRLAIEEYMTLMRMPGPDQTIMNWNNSAAPVYGGGDIRGGSSRAWGTYSALSVLPFKLAAMNALTTPYPYAMLGDEWMIPIQRYMNDDAGFSYATFYPFEYTQAFALGVEKNLAISNDGSERPRIGQAALPMGHFLMQSYRGNDPVRLKGSLFARVRSQTDFRVSIKALIMNFKSREGNQTRVMDFESVLYDPATDKNTSVGRVFMLENGGIIAVPSFRTFVMPIPHQKITFLDSKTGLAWVYVIEFDNDKDDLLAKGGVRAKLEEMSNAAINSCVASSNGLAAFFNLSNKEDFPGFLSMAGIESEGGSDKAEAYFASVKENYAIYKKKFNPPEGRCENALETVGAIVSTAGLLNGFWMNETNDYIFK